MPSQTTLLRVLKRRAAAAAARPLFDYTAGGLIPAANCIQAFDPWALAPAGNLAATYVDLTGNGNNAAVGVAPTLGADGWEFNGSTQYLDADITCLATYTIAVEYTYNGAAGSAALFGALNSMYFYALNPSSEVLLSYARGSNSVAETTAAGCIVAVGHGFDEAEWLWIADGYYYPRGGSLIRITVEDYVLDFVESTVLIGAMYRSGYPDYRHAAATVHRWSVYNTPLSATQAAALSAAMAIA